VNGRAARELSGTGDLIGQRVWEAFPEAVGGPFAALCEETMNGGPGGSVEAVNKRLRTWYDLHVRPSGQGLAVFFRNITEQREAREALRRSERLLQSALDTGRIVAWDCDLATGFVLRSENSAEVLGFGSGPGAEFIERIHPDDRTRFDEAWHKAVAEGTFHIEVRFRKPDGSWIWLDERGKLESRTDGKAVRVVGLLADITARKQAEIEAREKAALLEMTLEHMDQGLLVVDANRRIPLWNRRALELLGLPGELLKSDLTIDELIRRQVESGELAGADPALQKAVATGDFLQAPPIYQRVRPNGTVLEVRTAPLSNGGAVRTYTDATARRAAEHLIAESERRYRLLAENATDMIVRMDADGVRRYVSPASRELLGYEPDEMLGQDISWLIHPDDLPTVSKRLQEMLSGHRNQDTVTYRGRHRNDQWVWLESHRRLIRDQAGRPHEVVSVVRNISERRRLEEQLRQSQKMEAVGQLTGGIAHDFNNLLTVILGNAEILVDGLEDPHHRSAADIILGAAERGAGLTQQLLAFGRRQTLQTEPLHPAEVIEGMVPLLRRTIGEHIVLKTEFAAGQGWALADRTLLESAILNLAINARDAMPQGGILDISTDHVVIDAADQPLGAKPGRYLALTVSDTGTGMSSEVQERAFEPFFTTKGVGKGSGLGLSMVYGFAKQSGGHVGIRSAPGQGTSVTVLLPLAGAESALSEIKATPEPAPAARIRILVVEDEAEVRRFVTSLLLTLGHDVVEAGTGLSGLQVLLSDPTIDLLLTDVVLPGGMSGVELARRAQAARPGLRVLLTSGYPEEVFQAQGRPDAGTMILQKPYRRHELAEAVSRVLAPVALLAQAS
jgi:PAS domain S-box-containing protein